jgi:hypothetical protein
MAKDLIKIVVIGGLILVVAAVLWVSVLFSSLGSSNKQQPAKSLTTAQKAELQSDKAKACNTVSRLTKAGAFTKIEPGYSGVTHAYVDHDFFAIPVDAKVTTLKAVALCYLDLDKQQQLGIVVIHDGYSGKQIGTYDFASGLDLK